MGSKRVGLARTQALLQQLKSEIDMEGTMWGGQSSTAGPGLQSGSVAAPVTRVTNIGGQVVTTIQLDLENLSGSAGGQGDIIGNAEANVAGDSPAYLYQHKNDVNGILYKVEISCIETITGAATAGGPDWPQNLDFDISGSTLGSYGHGDVPAGDPFTVYAMGGNIAVGQTIADQAVTSSDDAYMYLVNGAAGSAGTGKFNAGKLVIRLFGHKDF